MSTLRVTNVQDTAGANSLTTAQIYNGSAKAWVNFNGTFGTSPFTTGNGGIRASFNVSSVTDNQTGVYTMNFTTAMVDANYVVTCESALDNASGSAGAWMVGVFAASGSGPLIKTTTQVQIRTSDLTGGTRDYFNGGVAIFR